MRVKHVVILLTFGSIALVAALLHFDSIKCAEKCVAAGIESTYEKCQWRCDYARHSR